ncbi:MAG: hypothetical protein CMI54_05665 [Parcubacteria group bacterium]|nr:hypothetical protein [Parcubacteria group bacterium]
MITMGAGAAMGYYIRMQAQKQADFMAVATLGIKAQKQNNEHQNDAAKRVSGWGAVTRRFVIIIVIGVAFLGLLLAMFGDYPVTVMHEMPVKSWLFGLIKTGGGIQTTTATGFVLPPYVPHMLSAISGFLFGAGAAKVTTK